MATTETVAPATRRLKILKPVTYARQLLAPGALVVVDAETAATWLRGQLAAATDEAMPCWRCGASVMSGPPRPRRPRTGTSP